MGILLSNSSLTVSDDALSREELAEFSFWLAIRHYRIKQCQSTDTGRFYLAEFAVVGDQNFMLGFCQRAVFQNDFIKIETGCAIFN